MIFCIDFISADFKFRCPALTNQTATNGTGSVVAAFNNPGPTDCMGMWSSSSPIMVGVISYYCVKLFILVDYLIVKKIIPLAFLLS